MLFGKSGGGLLLSLHAFGLLSAVELDVTVCGKIRSHSSVGSVSSPSSGNGSLHDTVSDIASLGVKSLGFAVVQKVLQKEVYLLCGLFGPSSFGDLVNFGLSRSSNASGVLGEGDDLLMLQDLFQISDSFVDFHSLASSSNFIGVLVVRSQVVNSGLGGLGWFSWLS